MTLKPWQWIAIILVTAALVVMAPSDETEVARKGAGPAQSGPKVPAPASDREPAHAVGRVELELLNKLKGQRQEKGKVSDVFNQTAEYVAHPLPKFVAPPPPVDLPPPVVVPVAPPMDFVYLGRYGEADSRIVVLSKGDRVYTVKVGDVIENTYRIEKFSPGMVNFTYLPLNITQSLTTGDSL
jgi:hypothetical protein